MTDVLGEPVEAIVSHEGALLSADRDVATLQLAAGGEVGGPLAIPQLAAIARLSARLGVSLSRPAIVAAADHDLDLWVQASPIEEGVRLSISGWARRPAEPERPDPVRELDLLRAGADWLWETDASLTLTSLSPSAAAMAGKPLQELLGKSFTRLFRLDGEGEMPMLEAVAKGAPFEDQRAEVRGTSRGAVYNLNGVPLFDGNGRLAGFRGSARAIAAGGAMRPASPVSAADLTAFGERLQSALRLPLNHIIRNAEAIGRSEEGELNDVYTGYAGDIASAGRHLLALVDDLVDLQAVERPDFAPETEDLDLCELARRAAGLLAVRAAAKGIRIDRPDDEDRLPAVGDYRRSLQVLVNLLGNAVLYSPEGSMIWIRPEREGEMACLTIADQGNGIAPEDQERIFGKFERGAGERPAGSGLGLYIARRLARAMGGNIVVDSAPGQGARFTFSLPAASDQR